MAQRLYQQFPKSLIKEVVSVYAKIPIGATGAVGVLDAKANMGIKAVVRNSAGNYTITLGNAVNGQLDQYNSLLMVAHAVLFNGVSAAPDFNVVSEDVIGAAQVVVQFSVGGVATDLDDTSILYLEIKVKNSSVV